MDCKGLISQTVCFGITDHLTRCILQNQPNSKAFGLLFGELSGNTWKASLTSELIFEENSDYTIHTAYTLEKIELIKKVFPSLEVIGWYAPRHLFAGNCEELFPEERFIKLHNQLNEISNENKLTDLFFLILYNESSETLSFSLYSLQNSFKEIPHEITLNEAEAVSIDSALKESHLSSGNFTSYFKNTVESINSLKSRLLYLREILDEEEQLKKSEEGRAILYETKEIINNFPREILNGGIDEITKGTFEQFLMISYYSQRNLDNSFNKPKGNQRNVASS